MKTEHRYISYCGKYYCAFCDYHKGTIVKAARNLLAFAERYRSLRLIADYSNACDFDEFMKGLKWLSSQNKPCKGCRFGGGWSWWGDCPVRDCCIERSVDFCYECNDFPCKRLQEEPLLDRKEEMIEINNKIKTVGIESWMQLLKDRYRRAAFGVVRDTSTELGAPCGLYCGSCKFYLTEKCGGCRTHRNEQCTIWKCAGERGLKFCGECSSFPCENNYATPAIAREWLDELKEAFGRTQD